MNDTFEVFLARLLERLKAELSVEADEVYALRRALLGVMLATSEVERRAAKRLVTFLLEDFGPLADHFSDQRHPLIGKLDVARHRETEHAELLFHQDLPDAIMEEPLSTDDLFLAGLKWPWELTAVRYVAFFDVMGFKAMLDGHQGNAEAIYEIMDALRDAAVSAEGAGYDTNAADSPMNYRGCWLRFAQFSDSIVLITRDDSMQSSAIISLAAQLMFGRALRIGVPIRGAIAKGQFTADFEKSIFFGQPLVDAYLLEERQSWYGACYHPSANDGGIDPDTGELYVAPDLPSDEWIPASSWYRVPVKTDAGYEEMNAINWALLFRGDPEGLDEAIERMRNDTDPKLGAYFEETRRFGHAMISLMGPARAGN